jgi:hypothetical protein
MRHPCDPQTARYQGPTGCTCAPFGTGKPQAFQGFTGANTPDGALPDQGPACNINDPGGGLVDCPSGTTQCNQVSNAPASLGVCVP